MKPKTKYFGLFRFVSVFRIYIETTETNSTVSKQTETTKKFLKNTQICSLSNGLGWSSVCFSSVETSKLSFGITTETNCFETNWKPGKTLHFMKKIPKYALYQTVLVRLLFVSVQSKHWNSLFRYRSETTETNVYFMILVHDSFLCLNCKPAFQSWSGMGSTGLWSFSPVLSSSKSTNITFSTQLCFSAMRAWMGTGPKIQFMYSQNWNCVVLFPIPTSCICEQFIYSQDLSAYFAAAK